MATRTSGRARPLDPAKQIPIVKTIEELDNVEGVAGLLEQARFGHY